MVRFTKNLYKITYNNSIEEIDVNKNHTFGIYPNPVKDKTINIVSKSASVEIQSLKVIDMSGLTIFEVNNIDITGNYNIHLPNISRGAYIVQISRAGNIETKKVIIE